MAPLSRKVAAASALLAASAASVSAAPTIVKYGDSIGALGLAKAITRKITSTGGTVTFSGSASIYGIAPSISTDVNYQLQFGYFDNADTDLLNGAASGVAFSAMPISAVQTGYKTVFNAATNVNGARNSNAGTVTLDAIEPLTEPLAGDYKNYVVVEFDINAPAGDLSLDYAVCTMRETPIGASVADLFMVTVEGVSGTSFSESNIATVGGLLVTPGNIVSLSPTPANWVPGFEVGLSTNFTNCLTSQVASETLAAGTYRVRITTTEQGSFATSNDLSKVGPIFSFVGAEVVTNSVDTYDPLGANLVGTDEAVAGSIDTWCVIADGGSTDFVPGFRMDAVNAAGNVCCRKRGTVNLAGDRCLVQFCANPADEVPSFVADPTSDACYTECKLPADYTGSTPEDELSPAIQGVWDDRVDPLVKYVGAPITDAEFNDVSIGANRRYVLAFADDQASTGVAIDAGGVTYVCEKRGVVDASGCLVGCSTVTADYLALGAAPGNRCFTECFSQL